MEADSEPVPDDIDALKAEVAEGRARAAADRALIAHQQLQIAKLRHQLYGQRSERAARLIEQMELGLEELEAAATEDEIAAEQAAARTTKVTAFARKHPSRQPFPEHLPRERVVEPAPANCSGEHPQAHLAGYAGILQADAYGRYGKLYAAGRSPGFILETGCWAHARRKFFVLADVEAAAQKKAQGKQATVLSPLCLEAVRRIDKLFDIERDINGCSA